MTRPAVALDQRADLFQGRTRERALVRGLFYPPLPEKERRVLHFTGPGGIGKTALARRFLEELRELHQQPDGRSGEPRPAFAAVDLAETWSRDPLQVLLQWRLQLGATFKGSRFPIFDFAYARIHAERFPGSNVRKLYGVLDADSELVRRAAAALPMGLGDCERIADGASLLDELATGVPGFAEIWKYVNRTFGHALHKLDHHTEPALQKVAQLGAEPIWRMLPECLGLDLRNAAATSDARPAVLILGDTTEMLRSAGGVGDDAWLRELVWRSPGVVFVLLGRDPLDWAERQNSPARDWKAIVAEHPLDHLQDDEVEAILEGYPVAEPAVREVIRQGSAGLPFDVGVQLDIYRDLLEAGMEPLPGDLAATPGEVLERFRSHVGERLLNTLRTLAFARGFDAELFAFLKARPGQLVGEVLLSEVTRFSFAETLAEGRYRLHQHYRDVECRETAHRDPVHARAVHEALFAFWDERCQPADVREVTSAHETALREAAHHKLRQGAGQAIPWLAERWPVFFEATRLTLCHELWADCLTAAEAELGPEHALVAVTLDNLGNVLFRLDALGEAREVQKRALRINEKVYGPEHAEVALTLANLGNVLLRLDALAEAREVLERALRINEKVYGPEHAQVAVTLGNLANALLRLDALAEAQAAQERALRIEERVFGTDRAEVAATLGNLGIVLERLDALAEAREAQERALRIRESSTAPSMPRWR